MFHKSSSRVEWNGKISKPIINNRYGVMQGGVLNPKLFKEISDFEMVHLSFLKNMLGVKQQTTSVIIYGDTGRYPLFLKQQILALTYWIRSISLPKSCYLGIVYSSLASYDFIGETNWCSHIRTLLFRTNHRDV